MLSILTSGTTLGTEGIIIKVEIDTGGGLGNHFIVGLPDAAVKESLNRIESAIKNCRFDFMFYKKFTVNLAPANIRKEGSSFDLPIAVGLLATEHLIPADSFPDFLILGELSLSGHIRPVRGVLPIAIKCRESGIANIIVPDYNKEEAALVQDLNVFPVNTLQDAVKVLRNYQQLEPYRSQPFLTSPDKQIHPDFCEIKGQLLARKALEIAAAGGHNILLIGSPGCGKTMMAKRFPSILPPLNYQEALEISKVYSIAGKLPRGLITDRPFRSPHHTISNAGLVGGGSIPRPGEISLAHLGVLFLDEFTEFGKPVLEVLRQPLEDGVVTISRSQLSLTYPARFILLAAMNPCPCGYYLDPRKECSCSPHKLNNYWKRLSGPLIDRMDIILEVPALTKEELNSKAAGENSAVIRSRIIKARDLQKKRFQHKKVFSTNAYMEPAEMKKHLNLSSRASTILNQAIDKMNLSGRGYDKALKVARTIADLAGHQDIEPADLAEALQLRSFIMK